jgi:hypothetical protein
MYDLFDLPVVTLGAHAQRGYCSWSVCVCVCLSVTLHLTSRMFVRLTKDLTRDSFSDPIRNVLDKPQ